MDAPWKSLRLCAKLTVLDRFADEDNRDLTDHRPIWNDVRDNIPESGVHTIYPPLGQGVFRLAHDIAPGSVLVLKSSMVIMDLLAAVFLFGKMSDLLERLYLAVVAAHDLDPAMSRTARLFRAARPKCRKNSPRKPSRS